MSSSSTDSSEDEEETKKISQAIVPNDFLTSLPFSSSTQPAAKDEPQLSTGVFSDKRGQSYTNDIPLKSKRSDKAVEEEDHHPPGYFLKTTPEFKAHVEKHLIKILDKHIDGNLQESVWEKSNVYNKRKQKGIKLFANDKKLWDGEIVNVCHQTASVSRSPPKIRPRKHKISSGSSDSSDEDKISSCVLTVEDIQHENRMLEDLSKSGLTAAVTVKELDDDSKLTGDEKSHSENDNGQISSQAEKRAKKKEKKKKKKMNGIQPEGSLPSFASTLINSSNDQSAVYCEHKMKKKKKKKKNSSENYML